MHGLRKILFAVALGLLVVPLVPGAAQARDHRVLELRDDCEVESWSVVPCAYGDDEDDGSVSEAEFRAELSDGGHGAWWIRQRAVTIDAGDTLSAENTGGIFHTLTEVDAFGRGCVPDWNVAVEETVENCGRIVTPQSLNLAPGQSATTAAPLSVGVHRFQCLIHPWMRTTVTVR